MPDAVFVIGSLILLVLVIWLDDIFVTKRKKY